MEEQPKEAEGLESTEDIAVEKPMSVRQAAKHIWDKSEALYAAGFMFCMSFILYIEPDLSRPIVTGLVATIVSTLFVAVFLFIADVYLLVRTGRRIFISWSDSVTPMLIMGLVQMTLNMIFFRLVGSVVDINPFVPKFSEFINQLPYLGLVASAAIAFLWTVIDELIDESKKGRIDSNPVK